MAVILVPVWHADARCTASFATIQCRLEGGEGKRGVEVAIIAMGLSMWLLIHVRDQELRAFSVAVMAMYVTLLMPAWEG